MQVSDVTPYAKNAKKHPEWHIKKIADSIRAFGCNQPVVVDGAGVLVAGHGRFEAMTKELGYTEMRVAPRAKRGEQFIPYVVADDLSQAEIAAYRLADNQLNALTGFNMDDVKTELVDIDTAGIDITLTGFDSSIFDEKRPGALADRFVVPPFSVLDTRQGYWTERKAIWKDLIGDNGESREGTLAAEDGLMGDINSGVSILDPVLAEAMIKWFGFNGGKAFDPFAGDTVFGYVAASNGMEFTGIELRQEQADLNNKRTAELAAHYICDDGQNVMLHLDVASQDLLFSCPPYFDLEIYSDDPKDASNQESYEDFMAILRNAFTSAIDALKQDRFAVIVVGDIRDKKGAYRRFPDDIKQVFEDAGMILYNDIILVESLGTLPQRVNNSMRNRKVGKCHQNVLVFYKGDPNNIKSNYPELYHASEDVEL